MQGLWTMQSGQRLVKQGGSQWSRHTCSKGRSSRARLFSTLSASRVVMTLTVGRDAEGDVRVLDFAGTTSSHSRVTRREGRPGERLEGQWSETETTTLHSNNGKSLGTKTRNTKFETSQFTRARQPGLRAQKEGGGEG
jgi:hypothetical protein